MKWIKASERLPKNMKEVFIKYSLNGNNNTAIGKCNTLFPMKTWYHKNGLYITFDSLEWLDESPSEQSEVEKLREEIERLKLLLPSGNEKEVKSQD